MCTYVYELKNLELTLSKNEQRKTQSASCDQTQNYNSSTAKRANKRERDEENESNAVRCYNKRPCWVVDEERERETRRAGGVECIAQSKQLKSMCDWCLALSLPLGTNVIQNVFSKRYSHTQLTCEEARQGKEMREGKGGAGQRTSTSTALIRAANLNAI